MKTPVRELDEQMDMMQETIKAAAEATPALIQSATKVAGYKASMWACAAFLTAVFTIFFFISVAMAGVKLAQFLWAL
jgi:hypothetical protein